MIYHEFVKKQDRDIQVNKHIWGNFRVTIYDII